MMNGITRDESLLLLTGETGSGKTTLCRAIIASMGERTFSSVLHQPYMTGPEMLRLILRDFGMVSKEELRRGALASADVPHLLEVLEGFLRSLASIQSRAIVVIDEAQSLSPTLLDEVRMLTAFERDGRRLVQIVLCGQPMLLNTLKTEPMYALNERITRRVALTPLSAAEVESYIYHRLAIAGGADAVSFQADAMRLIADLSRGLPRRINVLCDRTLQEGRADQRHVDHVGARQARRQIAGGRASGAGAARGSGRRSRSIASAISLDGERAGGSGRVLRMAGVGRHRSVVGGRRRVLVLWRDLARWPGEFRAAAARAGADARARTEDDDADRRGARGLFQGCTAVPERRRQLIGPG